ncbi:MAG: leucine-rich repeat domain-containing protein [Candidatus Amulumruptor caecigallinarius]|nr:leucine-rich repeat domain-containing protein [Candidatus Amulumruptor caecigallinarius]MCM1397215.1 leucine-rich repeat domain-containing protein [Candidatus Amulumruptor caecigallinarius]MCM1453096.1 leucine-rich repeat domain-containing protein [bacterium]
MKSSISRILHITLFLLCSIAYSSSYGANVSYTYKGVTLDYSLSIFDNTCTLTAASRSITGAVDIPAHISVNDKTYTVTGIQPMVFLLCENITSINVPNTIQTIGYAAFDVCSNLESVYISDGPTVAESWFRSCRSLKSVRLPATLAKSNGNNFKDCSSLESIQLPKSLSNIGREEFKNCTSLKEIIIPNSVKEISGSAFNGCSALVKADLPHDLTIIPSGLFGDCTSLESIKIPNTVHKIEGSAFRGCASLKSIVIPNAVDTIGGSAFYGCSALTSIDIGSGIKDIGSSAFENCMNIESIIYRSENLVAQVHLFDSSIYRNATLYVPSVKAKNLARQTNPWLNFVNIKKIGQRTAVVVIHKGKKLNYELLDETNCSLTSVPTDIQGELELPADVTIDGKTYNVTEIDDEALVDCKLLSSVTIPNSIAILGSYVFKGCTSLKSAVIPNSVKEIGVGLFQKCTSLNSVSFAADVEMLPTSIFNGCSSLLSYVVPEGITTIGKNAFNSCTKLESVSFPSTLSIIDNNAFIYCKNLKSIALPGNGCQIGEFAFTECESLDEVTIPSQSELTISTFSRCSNLKKITLGDYLKNMGRYTWMGAQNITEIVYNTETPLEAHFEIFDGKVYATARLLFPSETGVNAAKETEPWKRFINIGIIEDSEFPDVQADQLAQGGVAIYNLLGVKVFDGPENNHSLTKGTYIVLKNGVATKILIH